VRKAGNRVRITGQLIDTTTGAHIWADRFDGALDDIFELQDQVASSVVGAIEPKLRSSEIERTARKPTESLDAYDLYLRGHAQFFTLTDEGMGEAIALLKRALAIDPSYAPAAAMIGLCRITQRSQGLVLDPEEITDAMRLARRAIEEGKDDPDALWMAGWTIAYLAGEHLAAASAIERSLALNPNSAYAWVASGSVFCLRNMPGPASKALQRAMRLSPLDPLGWAFKGHLAFAHLVAGRYDEAVDWADQCLHEQPRHTSAIRTKVASCAHLGRMEEARDWLGRLLELQPGLTIAGWKASYAASNLSPPVLAVYMEGLRKAGLPEG
jgi:tetratricopeptide (TPR) repeat protein